MGSFASKPAKPAKPAKSAKPSAAKVKPAKVKSSKKASKKSESIKEENLKKIRIMACKTIIKLCKTEKMDTCEKDVKDCKQIIKDNQK